MEQWTINHRYRVERRIGEGGMAEVFLGHDQLLTRPVAIKVLREQFAQDIGLRLRFEREGQAIASFNHPHIVDVFDVGEHDQRPFLVMEYLRGDTLKRVITQEGPFDPDDVAALVEQVASALDYAHERGIVHRDIKPQNILVDADGLAKVVDFGIAKGLDDSNLTEAGAGIGTVHYVSPEQANGLMATPASDVYALGVIAFEMLTGSLPFDGETPISVALAHVRDDPPRPSAVEPALTGAIDAVVLQALRKDPTRRYRSAGEFASAMSNWRSYRAGGRHRGVTNESADAKPASTWPGPPPEIFRDPGPTLVSPVARHEAANSIGAPDDRPGKDRHDRRVAPPAEPVAPAARIGGAVSRDHVGWSTWVVGSVVVVALVVLIIIGANVSARMGRESVSDPATQPVAAVDQSNDQVVETVQRFPDEEADTSGVALVPVPDMLGRDPNEARALATDRGLVLEVMSESIFSETVSEGFIAQQDPPAETEIRQGEVVYVKLSRGSAEVDLAALDLVGRDPDESRGALGQLGLGVREEPVGSAEVPAGRVVAHTPANVAVVGETVTLFVSQGDAALIPVEAFGRPLESVVPQLESEGFLIINQVGVNRATIESYNVSLTSEGIETGDVVGVQDADETASFGVWLPVGTELTLIYYDANLDRSV